MQADLNVPLVNSMKASKMEIFRTFKISWIKCTSVHFISSYSEIEINYINTLILESDVGTLWDETLDPLKEPNLS